MAYRWCSAIAEAAERLHLAPNVMHKPHEIKTGVPDFFISLAIAFRLAGPENGWIEGTRLTHMPHHHQVFNGAFSSDDDDIIADAACAWIVGDLKPTESYALHFAKRVDNPRPFSPRLRQVAIRVIEVTGPKELDGWDSVIVRLFNHLNISVDELDTPYGVWQGLLVDVIRSPAGKNLSSHYWDSMGKLISPTEMYTGDRNFQVRDEDVMKLLKEAKDWEKLEIWMVIVWESLPKQTFDLEDIKHATLELLSSRPSALQRFKDLPRRVPDGARAILIEVLDEARAETLSYVSVHSFLFLSVLTPPFTPPAN